MDPEADPGEIQAQHELLFATLHALEEVLPYAAACGERPRPLTAACTLLERLAAQLSVHFAAEEREDRFGRISASDARLARKIARLVRDHRELEALAANLLEQARGSETEETWKQVSRRFWALRERLAWHEREENDLAFEAFQVDVGESAGG